MQPTIEIFIGSSVSGTEAQALFELVAQLPERSLILANFEIEDRSKSTFQIDFLVVTPKRAELIELKALTTAVFGRPNGTWRVTTAGGGRVPYEGKNPWVQARDAKFAISDAMARYAKLVGMPRSGGHFYQQFDASVTIYPDIPQGSDIGCGNFKVWIRSFAETVHALTSEELFSQHGWSLEQWRMFACD